ncbi:glycerate kinase [Niveibacterium sp. SC-1]|uniref:glycerate kinase type-2 family protein n=1 Tax=Niveibacterium sp. SC-1 TaxID=3135646 RepID=UPI0031204BCC
MSISDPAGLLRGLYAVAVARAQPERLMREALVGVEPGPACVIGAGKAAGSMAAALEDAWPGAPEELSGLVITRYGHARPTRRIEMVEAAHPYSDEAGRQATQRMLSLLDGLSANDRVIALLSGGGSALLTAPAAGVSFETKQMLTRALLRCGADIGEINCVRKHLSAVKGGRLALRAWPARVLTLAISDVVGDDPAVIASGPTVHDPSTRAQALSILEHYDLPIPPDLRAWLHDPAAETAKAGDPRLAQTEYRLIASPAMSLHAAADHARDAGVTPVLLGDAIEGEAAQVARVIAGIARACRNGSGPARAPCVLLSGGETSVTLPAAGQGRGGRNTEFLLALALALKSAPGIHALAADTDGIDGSEDNAGALISPDTLARAAALACSPERALREHDAWGFFHALGDLLVTGPSYTNVNDFRAVLVL